MVQRHAFFALTNPAPGREDEFNAWYDDHHLREVVEHGIGMKGGRRFRLAEAQRPGHTPPWRYLAWYDLEIDDLAAYHREPWRTGAGALKPFDGLVAEGFSAWVLTPMGDPVGDDGAGGFGRGCPHGDDFLFLALTDAAAGHEDAFNAWYDDHHLSEIVATLQGFDAGRRFRAADEQRPNQPVPPWRYVAAYAVRADSAAAVHENARAVTGLTRPPPGALDPGHVAWLFEPIGPYVAL
jgi:hypothetical protein